jgi:hypothetical protein
MEQENNGLWSVLEKKIFHLEDLKKQIGIWKLRSHKIVLIYCIPAMSVTWQMLNQWATVW